MLSQRRPERGDDQYARAAGLLHPRGQEGSFFFEGHERPPPAAPPFWRGPGGVAPLPESLLESGDGGPPHAQQGRRFLQGRPGQGGQEDGLGGAQVVQVGGPGHPDARLGHELRIDAARS